MHLGCLQKGLTMGAFVFSFKDILTTFASQTEWVEKISQKAEFSSSAEVERCKQQDLKTLNTQHCTEVERCKQQDLQNTQHCTGCRVCTMRQRNRERRLLRFTSVEQSMHFSGGDACILASYLFPINKKIEKHVWLRNISSCKKEGATPRDAGRNTIYCWAMLSSESLGKVQRSKGAKSAPLQFAAKLRR